MSILPDTSIWISYFNNPSSFNSENLYNLIIEDQVYICPPIYQEILQGTRNDKSFLSLTEKLSGLMRLQTNPYEAAIGSAQIYSSLRQKGFTIRKSNDCLLGMQLNTISQYGIRIETST